MLDQAQAAAPTGVATPANVIPELGPVRLNETIRSARGPFKTVPQRFEYPTQVINALIGLYADYNKSFVPIMRKNREGGRGYPYCGNQDNPRNWFVQIDMVGLPDDLLAELSSMPVKEVRQVLRKRIFEIEDSVAMYELLQEVFPGSPFKQRFRDSLEVLRNSLVPEKHKRLALLAVTAGKYDAILADEFGLPPGTKVSDEEVYRRTGFDCLMGPDEFLAHLQQNNGECTVALYVRASNPVDKQRDPSVVVEHPLLSNAKYRQIIRENSLTLNVDDPAWPAGDSRCLNDTKVYMYAIDMGFPVRSPESIVPASLIEHGMLGLRHPYKGAKLQPDFAEFLVAQGADRESVLNGTVGIRMKPMYDAYGCHGHFTGRADSISFMNTLVSELRNRGPYVAQPELVSPVANIEGEPHEFIDRVFLSGATRVPVFLGGLRSFMPKASLEAKRRRNHGNSATRLGEIWGG